jgi:hypothetical protein
MAHYFVYVRQSYRRHDDADVSEEQQEEAARRLLPKGATAEVIRDTGGHRSGRTEPRRLPSAHRAAGRVRRLRRGHLMTVAAGLKRPADVETSNTNWTHGTST